jgi:hypothetical protein
MHPSGESVGLSRERQASILAKSISAQSLYPCPDVPRATTDGPSAIAVMSKLLVFPWRVAFISILEADLVIEAVNSG